MAKRKRRAPVVATGRAVAVVRVSTGMQVESGASLDAQREAVEHYAKAMGLELVEVVEDPGVSGAVPLAQRPGGRRVLELIERGEVGAVIAPKLDRLFRDAADALAVTREWDRHGVALHLLDVRLDTSSPMGRLFFTLLAAFSEWERSAIASRTSTALQHLAAQGVVLGADPLGRRRGDERDEHGRLVVVEVPEEIATVERIVALRRQGLTLRAIAAALEAEGHKPKRSRSGKWAISVIRDVLARALREQGDLNRREAA
jgi:DNA invertase Pin-like site-specific DNA recombinase